MRWRLQSWGGEATSATFTTPDGPGGSERSRFVTLAAGAGATLATIDQLGHPVVACLEPSDALRPVEIDAVIWGVTDENGTVVLWLRECAITPDPPRCAVDADCVVAHVPRTCATPCTCPVVESRAIALTWPPEVELAVECPDQTQALCEQCEDLSDVEVYCAGGACGFTRR